MSDDTTKTSPDWNLISLGRPHELRGWWKSLGCTVSRRACGAVFLTIGFALGGMPAHANVTYSYSGTPFTSIVNGPPAGSRITGGVTFASALAPNSNYSAADVLDFSFNDGALTIDKSNSRPGNEVFSFTTNAAGDIAFWNVQAAYQFPLTLEAIRMTTLNEPTLVSIDETQAVANGIYLGVVTNDPGVWTLATVAAVPEPSIAALLGIGLFSAGVSRARRRKTGDKASLPG